MFFSVRCYLIEIQCLTSLESYHFKTRGPTQPPNELTQPLHGILAPSFFFIGLKLRTLFLVNCFQTIFVGTYEEIRVTTHKCFLINRVFEKELHFLTEHPVSDYIFGLHMKNQDNFYRRSPFLPDIIFEIFRVFFLNLRFRKKLRAHTFETF